MFRKLKHFDRLHLLIEDLRLQMQPAILFVTYLQYF